MVNQTLIKLGDAPEVSRAAQPSEDPRGQFLLVLPGKGCPLMNKYRVLRSCQGDSLNKLG